MGELIEPGIDFILFLQSLGTRMYQPMLLLSFLGTEPFFLVIAPAFLWCVDTGWGIRVGLALTLSSALNSAFKLALHSPRPYWVDQQVIPISAETSFGAPSGHAQHAAAVWGMVAAWARLPWLKAALWTLVFLIGLSRMVLGMHFLHDVLLGWVLGVALLVVILAAERALTPWLERGRPATVITAALGAALALILLNLAVRAGLQGWELPAEWVRLAARAPNAVELDPLSIRGAVSSAAAFFGIAAGAALLKERGGLDAGGAPEMRFLRYLLGVAGMLAIYICLDLIFPDGDTIIAYLFRFVRYALVGLWAAFLAPELFIRLRLAQRPQS